MSEKQETLESLFEQAQRQAEEHEESWSEARHKVDVIFDRMMEMANDETLDDPMGRAIEEYGGQYETAQQTEKVAQQDYFDAAKAEQKAWKALYAYHEQANLDN